MIGASRRRSSPWCRSSSRTSGSHLSCTSRAGSSSTRWRIARSCGSTGRLVSAGPPGALGGAFYGPVLASIPERTGGRCAYDQLAQAELELHPHRGGLGAGPGIYAARRALPVGVRYTVVDDALFCGRGCSRLRPWTLRQPSSGSLVSLFPIDRRLSESLPRIRLPGRGSSSRQTSRISRRGSASPCSPSMVTVWRPVGSFARGVVRRELSLVEDNHAVVRSTFPTRGPSASSRCRPGPRRVGVHGESREQRRYLQFRLDRPTFGAWSSTTSTVRSSTTSSSSTRPTTSTSGCWRCRRTSIDSGRS